MLEDLRPSGDITSQLIRNNNKLKAKIISNENTDYDMQLLSPDRF